MRTISLFLATMMVGLTGCATTGSSESPEETQQQSQSLVVAAGPRAVGYDFSSSDNLLHGVAADANFVFTAQPLNGRIAVLNRWTGTEVGEISPPPGGFLLPFNLRVSGNRLYVLDAGGFPNPNVPSIPRVYAYSYSWNGLTNTFNSSLQRSVMFNNLPLIFAEDLEVLPNGNILVAESIFGAIWIVAPDNSIRPGLFPSNPAAPLPYLGPCFAPGPVNVDGVPFSTAGSFAPGLSTITSHNGNVYWSSFCHGGVQRISVSTLFDTTRSAEDRATEIQVVTARAPNTQEVLKGLTFNPYQPNDHRLYALDAFNTRLVRINTQTGARTTLLEDSTLFNFSVGAVFLPPAIGALPISTLVVTSDQEHRFAGINSLLTENIFEAPFLTTKVFIRD